ncbi:hypothetical protein ABE151_17520 [Bacillus paralicheniformis]|uniref:hypothetical protein n=1 Tax=Bacillus paralicheniformis TaxID=1648923 RepID=UPI003D24D45E
MIFEFFWILTVLFSIFGLFLRSRKLQKVCLFLTLFCLAVIIDNGIRSGKFTKYLKESGIEFNFSKDDLSLFSEMFHLFGVFIVTAGIGFIFYKILKSKFKHENQEKKST